MAPKCSLLRATRPRRILDGIAAVCGDVQVDRNHHCDARLQRGEHGIFVTSSYFTRQAQEEVFADKYPVELLYGSRLLSLLTQVGAIRNGTLDPAWVRG